MQEFQMLWPQSAYKIAHPGEITAWLTQTIDEPNVTGSAPVTKTMGIVLVAAFAANEDGTSYAVITDTLRATSSPASDDKRSYRPSAQRHSMLTFLPSTKPASFSPWMRRPLRQEMRQVRRYPKHRSPVAALAREPRA